MEKIDYTEEYEKVKSKYDKYIRDKFDFKNDKIKYKYEHTYRVVDYAEHIARDLGLNEEDVFIAKVIALLHDFGRFEQITMYNNLVDSETMDHGDYAANVLFKENLIREFLEDSQYDIILKEGVLNHNKYEIKTKRLTEQQLLHAKIIRDADKTDSFYLYANKDMFKLSRFTKEELENSVLSDVVYEEFMDEKPILISDIETPLDSWMFKVAFVFGYNFVSGLKILKNEDYINMMKNKVEFKNEETINKIQNMYKLVENYVNYRILNDINF